LAPTVESLVLSALHYRQMLGHLLECLPAEGCGMLGGLPGELRSRVVLPVPNALNSPVRFRMNPEEQLKAFYALEERGLDMLAVFHSHPAGPDHPSQTDLAEFAYPGILYLIWSPAAGEWQCRAYRISSSAYETLPIEIIPEVSIPGEAEGL
jgi:proteasome lid subunit RPN8/RPN11